MAGTRLVLQASFLLEFLTLALLALVIGLCSTNDLVCRPLLEQPRRRRRLLLLNDIRLSQSFLSVPSVRIATAESSAVAWQALFHSLSKPHDGWSVRPNGYTHTVVCADEIPNHEVDVWICGTATRPRMVVQNGTAIVYVRDNQRRQDLQSHLYPSSSSSSSGATRSSVSIQLVTDRTDWNMYWEAVHRFVQDSRMNDWPSLSHLQIGVQYASLSPTSMDGNENSTDYHKLDRTRILPSLKKPSGPTVYLLVPNAAAVFEKDHVTQQSHGTSLLAIVSSVQDVATVLDATVLKLVQQWMGVPATLAMESRDGSFPRIYSTVWYQRTMIPMYDNVRKDIQETREKLQNLPRGVAVTTKMGTSIVLASEALDRAMNLSRDGHLDQALHELDKANDLMSDLHRSTFLLEPLDFPLDQRAAIFAPLLLPVLLPLLIGLFRERKRYVQLRDHKRLPPDTSKTVN